MLHVLYLIFNEGYTSSVGPDLQRNDLSDEAIRLTRTVRTAPPRRRRGRGPPGADAPHRRTTPGEDHRNGELIPLAEQDRSLWDKEAIEEGVALITTPSPGDRSAPTSSRPRWQRSTTRLPSTEETDWEEILALYGVLERIVDNPMVTAQSRHRRGHGPWSAGRAEAPGGA